MSVSSTLLAPLYAALHPGQDMPTGWEPNQWEKSDLTTISNREDASPEFKAAFTAYLLEAARVLSGFTTPLSGAPLPAAARVQEGHPDTRQLQEYRLYAHLVARLRAEPAFLINEAKRLGLSVTPGSVLFLAGSNALSFSQGGENKISGHLQMWNDPFMERGKIKLPQIRLEVQEDGFLTITHGWGSKIERLAEQLKIGDIKCPTPLPDLKKFLQGQNRSRPDQSLSSHKSSPPSMAPAAASPNVADRLKPPPQPQRLATSPEPQEDWQAVAREGRYHEWRRGIYESLPEGLEVLFKAELEDYDGEVALDDYRFLSHLVRCEKENPGYLVRRAKRGGIEGPVFYLVLEGEVYRYRMMTHSGDTMRASGPFRILSTLPPRQGVHFFPYLKVERTEEGHLMVREAGGELSSRFALVSMAAKMGMKTEHPLPYPDIPFLRYREFGSMTERLKGDKGIVKDLAQSVGIKSPTFYLDIGDYGPSLGNNLGRFYGDFKITEARPPLFRHNEAIVQISVDDDGREHVVWVSGEAGERLANALIDGGMSDSRALGSAFVHLSQYLSFTKLEEALRQDPQFLVKQARLAGVTGNAFYLAPGYRNGFGSDAMEAPLQIRATPIVEDGTYYPQVRFEIDADGHLKATHAYGHLDSLNKILAPILTPFYSYQEAWRRGSQNEIVPLIDEAPEVQGEALARPLPERSFNDNWQTITPKEAASFQTFKTEIEAEKQILGDPAMPYDYTLAWRLYQYGIAQGWDEVKLKGYIKTMARNGILNLSSNLIELDMYLYLYAPGKPEQLLSLVRNIPEWHRGHADYSFRGLQNLATDMGSILWRYTGFLTKVLKLSYERIDINLEAARKAIKALRGLKVELSDSKREKFLLAVLEKEQQPQWPAIAWLVVLNYVGEAITDLRNMGWKDESIWEVLTAVVEKGESAENYLWNHLDPLLGGTQALENLGFTAEEEARLVIEVVTNHFNRKDDVFKAWGELAAITPESGRSLGKAELKHLVSLVLQHGAKAIPEIMGVLPQALEALSLAGWDDVEQYVFAGDALTRYGDQAGIVLYGMMDLAGLLTDERWPFLERSDYLKKVKDKNPQQVLQLSQHLRLLVGFLRDENWKDKDRRILVQMVAHYNTQKMGQVYEDIYSLGKRFKDLGWAEHQRKVILLNGALHSKTGASLFFQEASVVASQLGEAGFSSEDQYQMLGRFMKDERAWESFIRLRTYVEHLQGKGKTNAAILKAMEQLTAERLADAIRSIEEERQGAQPAFLKGAEQLVTEAEAGPVTPYKLQIPQTITVSLSPVDVLPIEEAMLPVASGIDDLSIVAPEQNFLYKPVKETYAYAGPLAGVAALTGSSSFGSMAGFIPGAMGVFAH